MKSQRNEMETVSRPRDKSIEAYKVWTMEIAQRLVTEPTAIQLTEAEWITSWKEYWKENAPAGKINELHSR